MSKINPFDAQRILEDEVFRQGVSLLKERYKEQWVLSPTADAREKLHQKVLLLDEVINELRIAIHNK